MLKLCIACSSKVPASNRSCACGHVFSPESRRIGGKRFSGYRLGITRRQSSCTLREKQQNGFKADTPTNKSQARKSILNQTLKTPKVVQEKANIIPEKPSKRRGIHAAKENRAKAKMRKLQHIVDVLSSPEKRLKLSLALAEINRRLSNQMMIWKMLPSETG